MPDKQVDIIDRLRTTAVMYGEGMFGNHQVLTDAATEIEHLRRIVSDIRVLYYAGQFKQFEGEPWLRRVLNIDLQR